MGRKSNAQKEFDQETYNLYRGQYLVPPKKLYELAQKEFGYEGGREDFKKFAKEFRATRN